MTHPSILAAIAVLSVGSIDFAEGTFRLHQWGEMYESVRKAMFDNAECKAIFEKIQTDGNGLASCYKEEQNTPRDIITPFKTHALALCTCVRPKVVAEKGWTAIKDGDSEDDKKHKRQFQRYLTYYIVYNACIKWNAGTWHPFSEKNNHGDTWQAFETWRDSLKLTTEWEGYSGSCSIC